MSMCKLNTVTSARKAQGKCQKCGTPIEVGDGYRWWQGRYTSKRVRCLKSACYPQSWERETNPLRAEHMQAEALVSEAQGIEDDPVTAAARLSEAVELVQGLVDQLNERVSSWQSTNLENSQQYQSCEASAQDLESWVGTIEPLISELEAFDTPEGDWDDEAYDQWAADVELTMNQIDELPELDLGA